MARRCAIIAGGGTGGHIYPGIAIAKEAQRLDPTLEVHFVGSRAGLEKQIVPKNGFPLHFIEISGLAGLSLAQKLKTMFLLPVAFFQSIYWIMKLNPVFVLGVGGYSSGPVVLAATLLRHKTAIWEANVNTGLANRLLSRWVEKVFTVFEDTKNYLLGANVSCQGLPIRESMLVYKRAPSERLRLLVFGGSQGARGINQTVSKAFLSGVDNHEAWVDQVEVFHQTGRADFEEISKIYSARSTAHNFKATPYIDDMSAAYAAADLVVSRSGAGTIAELAACGKASILVPFPFAADNHQQKNAEALVSQNAATMVLQKDFTSEKFVELLKHFLIHREEIETFETRILKFHRTGAARNIVKFLLGIEGVM